MNAVCILTKTDPHRLLQALIDENTPVFITYLSDKKWSIARGIITDVREEIFKVRITPQSITNPVRLQPSTSVGVTFQYGLEQGYGRFVFQTIVESVESAENGILSCVSFTIPDEVDLIQRRSFLRVKVPQGLDVPVNIRMQNFLTGVDGQNTAQVHQGWTGKLIDISAGGLAVAVSLSDGPAFEKGQFLNLKFTPLPTETPLCFNAYVKSVLPSADGKSICIGLAMVGLEASPEGRLILQRLCNTVEQYTKKNTV